MDDKSNNQQVVTTPYNSNQNNLPAVDDDDLNPDSIWNQPVFPSKTKPAAFTPAQLKTALTEYSETTKPLREVLDENGISINMFYVVSGLYREINDFYLHAREKKAMVFGGEVEKALNKLPDQPEMYVYDRKGNRSLSTAAVGFLKLQAENALRLAQVHETGSFIPLSKQETTNRNLNVGVQLTGNLPANYDISTAAPGDLVDILKGRKRV